MRDQRLRRWIRGALALLADLGGAATAIATGLAVAVGVVVAGIQLLTPRVMAGLGVAAALITFGVVLHLLGPKLARPSGPAEPAHLGGRPMPGTEPDGLLLRRATRHVWTELAENRSLVGRMQQGLDLWEHFQTDAWRQAGDDLLDLAAPRTFRACAEAYRRLAEIERFRDEQTAEIDPQPADSLLFLAGTASEAAMKALEDSDRPS